MADPAFDAHLLPIEEWATAVREERLPRDSLHGTVAKGKRQLEKAKDCWAACRGPGIAFVATCRRLRWVVKDVVDIVTDDGEELQLHLDSPAAVGNQVQLAVKRWRWRALENMPQLAKGASGAGEF